MNETTVNTEAAIINDTEYIEAYFKICELFQKKRTIINDLQHESIEKSDNAISTPKDKSALIAEISRINLLIKGSESRFWDKVKASLEQGKKFVIENIALAYELDGLDKRVLLFFLYLEFFYPSQNKCSKDELTRIFDLEDSLVWRMRTFKCFSLEGKLVNRGILIINREDNQNSTECKLWLPGNVAHIFSRMLDGEHVELMSKKGNDISACEEIGRIKEPEYIMDNVVLKDDIKEKIMLFTSSCGNEALKDSVEQKVTKICKGLVFLFFGPPGTGKTMLAEAVASLLNKKLLIVEYPKITSRWFGETDKKISQAFRAAKENNLVLLMDEADSLLYNRNYAGQEHDIRFVNDMLQELDRFEGVAVLTTNMDDLLDPAVERRITLRVKLEEPSESMRAQIWKAHIPSQIKLAQDVDFTILARRYEFSGGYIRNAVQATIRKITLSNKDTISMDDLIFGANIEKEGIFNKQKRSKIGFFATQ